MNRDMATSSSASSPTTSSVNNEQQQQRQADHGAAGLPSLESFLFLPQLPVDGDDGNEGAFLFRHHHRYHVHPQTQRQKRSLRSLLSIIKPAATKSNKTSTVVTSSISTNACNFIVDPNNENIRKQDNVSCYPSNTLSKHPLINTTITAKVNNSDDYSNESNLVCGRLSCKMGNSRFPSVATNDTVIATSALSNNHSNSINDTQIVVVNNKSEEQQRCSSSLSAVLINKNYSYDCEKERNHHSSPFSFAANHQQHHRNHPHLHQYHPHHNHHHRRWLIFRVCQVFSVLLCAFFLSYLVKTSLWVNDEYTNRVDVYSFSSHPLKSSSFVSSRLQNRLIQSWNMPSMVSPSSSPTTLKIPKTLPDSINGSSNNNNDNANDGDKHTLLLLDVPNFRFLMNNKTKCNVPRDDDNYRGGDDDGTSGNNDGGANTIFFMIIVHSAPQNFQERQAIRETWGSLQRLGQFHIRLVFLLGHDEPTDDNHHDHSNDIAGRKNEIFAGGNDKADSKNHDTFYGKIQRESQQHGDIVTGNFYDSYRNLTYKHLMGYLWVLNHCSHAKFVLKADDDAFIDIFQLFKFILRTFGSEPEAALICNVFPEGTKPVRRSDAQGKKWIVTYEEYQYDFYPKYCGGLAYLATPNVIHEIYGVSRMHNKFLWIDDVYVTGILRELAHVEPFYLNLRYAYDPEEYRKWLSSKESTRQKHNVSQHYAINKFTKAGKSGRVGVVGGTTTTAETLSNQMKNERRPSPPQKIPFMIVHLERGSHLAKEMRELWNKTVSVWSGSGLTI